MFCVYKVDIDEVRREYVACGAFFDGLVNAADLYGVFEDLYGPELMFRPCVDIKVRLAMKFKHKTCDDYYLLPPF